MATKQLLFLGASLLASAECYTEHGRWKLFPDDEAGYAHPAVVGSRLYLRGNGSMMAIELGEK